MSAMRASLLHLKTESNEILNKISIFLYIPKTEQIHLSQMGEKITVNSDTDIEQNDGSI